MGACCCSTVKTDLPIDTSSSSDRLLLCWMIWVGDTIGRLYHPRMQSLNLSFQELNVSIQRILLKDLCLSALSLRSYLTSVSRDQFETKMFDAETLNHISSWLIQNWNHESSLDILVSTLLSLLYVNTTTTSTIPLHVHLILGFLKQEGLITTKVEEEILKIEARNREIREQENWETQSEQESKTPSDTLERKHSLSDLMNKREKNLMTKTGILFNTYNTYSAPASLACTPLSTPGGTPTASGRSSPQLLRFPISLKE